MADTDPIGPFDVSVQDVADLVPQARFPDELGAGQYGVTKTMVAGYITEVSRRVDLRLVDRARLTKPEHLATLQAAAADLVANGAASYAQAARFAEQSAANRDGYAAVLWARYTTGLDELAATLAGWVDDPDDATPESNDSPAYSFPPVRVGDGWLP